ncbi:MAG: hypothetical protein JSV93_03795 [Candidatus Omnitrophota bacterium]|nr:MAG: hypothetical protein JSV93_03795 [Candidatus Omnitrophota bacterium]
MKIIAVIIKIIFVIAAVSSILTNVVMLKDRKEVNKSAKELQQTRYYENAPTGFRAKIDKIEAASGSTVIVNIGQQK